MNWVERRARLDSAMPELWNLLCIEIEQALESFEKHYGQEQRITVAGKRIQNCFHLAAKTWTGTHERSIDVCLDAKNRRIFARNGGAEILSVQFGFDAEGLPCIADAEGSPMNNDRACQSCLEGFLFPPVGA